MKNLATEHIKGVPIKCYVSLGSNADKYCVFFIGIKRDGDTAFRAMSERPDLPDGVSIWSEGRLGNHNGMRISFDSLPEECKKVVMSDIKGIKYHANIDKMFEEAVPLQKHRSKPFRGSQSAGTVLGAPKA